jgi:hypothetical protein
MKKIMLVWALVLTVGIGSSFARPTESVSQQTISAFKRDFASAQDVSWEINKETAKATFNMSGQVMFAYYSQAGELLAVTRNIVSTQLPINLIADLKKGYNEYWISDLFEMAVSDSSSYYITLENGDQTVVLKSTGAAGWEVFKKVKKSV